MQTKMTSTVRTTLMIRSGELDKRIAELEGQRENGDPIDAAILASLCHERDQIKEALLQASIIDDAPFDEHRIEVGDTVTVADQAGQSERYVLVDAGVGARVSADWVSAASPLGAALIGRGRGDEILVRTPAGEQRFVILDFERSRALSDDAAPPAA